MNRIFLPRVATLLLASLVWGGVHGNPKTPEKDHARRKQQMVEFFTARLSGSGVLCEDRSGFPLSDIDRERAAVWEAWREANDGFAEEKLIALEDLKERKSGAWRLPEELEAGAVMPYYWGSKGERPEGGYPLFVYLHGSGPKAYEWDAGIALARTFEDAPSVYFIPQMPDEKQYRWYPRSKQYAWEKLLRLALVSGEVDPDMVYFFGISEGAYGSQRMASFYADYLAGAGPMAGGEPLRNAPPENCRNTAFSLRTGADDTGFYRNVLTQYTKDEFDRLREEFPADFDHWIELIPGRGHSIDYRPTTPWLRRHVRNPHPRFVSWENMEMDGRYRSGFYNLLVGERSNDDESQRTYYELAIDGNDISLRVDLVAYEVVEKDPTFGIEMKFDKRRTPATKGRVTIFLCDELVDLGKKITLTVNGKKVFAGRVKPERRHLANSCAAFFDPARLYPAAIEVDIAGPALK